MIKGLQAERQMVVKTVISFFMGYLVCFEMSQLCPTNTSLFTDFYSGLKRLYAGYFKTKSPMQLVCQKKANLLYFFRI